MVAEGERKPINLHRRDFVFTIPASDVPQVLTISPHKKGRAIVLVPEGSTVEVRKLLTNEQESDKI
jgi:hypothetical protein